MIYLINSYSANRIGHFWTWDQQIRDAYNESGIYFTYLSPSANLARETDSYSSEQNYFQIDKGDFVNEARIYIKRDIELKGFDQIVLMFPFLSQFTERDLELLVELEKQTKAKVAIAGITLLTTASIFRLPSTTRYSFQTFFEKKSSRILWVGEEVRVQSDFIRPLPDFMSCIKRSKNRDHSLSFYGSLNAYRGMSEILFIALLNPGLKVRIKGHGFASNRVWRPIKFKGIRFTTWRDKPLIALTFNAISVFVSLLRFLPNVEFSSEPFATEMQLDAAISESGSVFYCAKLPYGSGIVVKSLYSEVPILWPGISGHAFNLLKRGFPQGEVRYIDFFVPGRITKKLAAIHHLHSQPAFSWEQFVKEMRLVKELL